MRKIIPLSAEKTPLQLLIRCELAFFLRVNVSTVSRLVREGLPCVYVGKTKTISRGSRPRFEVGAVLAWLRENRTCEI